MTIFFVNTGSNKIPLSVVLISLNEAANIEKALKSVAWADEVIVYDSGSTDNTVSIAENMGAKVTCGPWYGFGKTKKHAAGLAKNSWILSLDCDEEVTTELVQEIKEKWESLNPEVAYRIPRLSYYLNSWIRHGGWYPDYQIRLFNVRHSNWNEASIHEKVEAKQYDILASRLNHYVFKNIEDQVSTNNRYSSLQALELRNKGKSFTYFHFLTKPVVKFVECYVLKLGFLDGFAGFAIAKNAGYSVFLKWAKLRELEMQSQRKA